MANQHQDNGEKCGEDGCDRPDAVEDREQGGRAGRSTGRGKLVHACRWDANAMKNYYLIWQISDMVERLYE